MKKFKFVCGGAVVVVVAGSIAAFAQGVPHARQVARQLYRTGKGKAEVQILRPDLIPAALLPAIKAAGQIQKYYEAMAVSPDEGLEAGSAFQAINYHSVAAAEAAAISGCSSKKKKQSSDCVIVARFVPKGYKGPSAFSLSMNATKVFRKKYRFAGRNKAFAISPASGNWGYATRAASLAAARDAALAKCAKKAAAAGANDCRVVTEN